MVIDPSGQTVNGAATGQSPLLLDSLSSLEVAKADFDSIFLRLSFTLGARYDLGEWIEWF